MYLSKKQIDAINTALRALEDSIQRNENSDECSSATGVLYKMKYSDKNIKRSIKRKREWNKKLTNCKTIEINGENVKKLFNKCIKI